MKLKKLFNGIPGIEIRGSKEVEIMGLCAHSRRVAPGDLFIAKRGFKRDGSEFINEAILAGAVAILTDIYNPFLEQISQIIHPNPNAIEAEIANRFYDYPSDKLNTIAITGTNGKTMVAYLARFLLDDHIPVGMIGTVETITGKHRMLSEFTTPDCLTLHKLLKEMVINHCPFGVMEVTSHAIDQKRIQG
ncbi:MAG: UDP-N-acetylmuramoyl-L-alanyl-D-glutamate--2,6-diaminopimelate ligase, partial [Simkaniaceae bacterium]|nr:UDP-N-acetylmuramoyl-L-alanyl-D-glutamate--2,6-diaminopimelate ligase [Simkaniaceae bacterium]